MQIYEFGVRKFKYNITLYVQALESKTAAAGGHIYYAVTDILFIFWNILTN